MAATFAVLSLILSIGAYVPYWRSILRDGTRPRKATWIVWTAVDAIMFTAMLAQGELALQMLAYTIGAGSVMVYALWKGEQGWTREDVTVLAGSALAMVLWFVVDANTAIAVSLIAISIGTIPTWKAAWRNPRNEPFVPWLMFWIGGLFGLLAIQEWTVASALGPGGFFALQSIMVFLTFPARRAKVA